MKTAGLVLDFYDDRAGETLKKVFPVLDDLPDVIKEAHILIPEERDVLRDEAFALILHNEGVQLRKFACVDAGNVLLSSIYFVENKDKLPEEAQKTAAANILAAAEEFGLTDELDPLIKAAGLSTPALFAIGTGGGAALGAAAGAARPGKNKDGTPRTRGKGALRGAAAGSAVGKIGATGVALGTAPGRAALKHDLQRIKDVASKFKKKTAAVKAKASSKTGMARSRDSSNQPFVGDESDWAQRTNLVSIQGGSDSGRVIPSVNQMKTASQNIVDVSREEAPVVLKNKTASRYALGDRYVLDAFEDVQHAVGFFEANWTALAPHERHEFAVKTAARADELGIQVPELMDRYGSTEYAPDVEAHIANRISHAPRAAKVYNELREKIASVSPDQFVQLLTEADVDSSLYFEYGGAVCDPYFATYGGRGVEKNAGWSWSDGESSLNEEQLKEATDKLNTVFTEDVVSAFQENPIQIFDSMPREQKLIIARLVQE